MVAVSDIDRPLEIFVPLASYLHVVSYGAALAEGVA
jgi:hypothetical protein